MERRRNAPFGMALAAIVAALGAPAGASATPDPPLGPNERAGSNLGLCSPYLGGGGAGVRPMINQLLASNGELFGVSNPGELYSVRARSEDDRECLRRR